MVGDRRRAFWHGVLNLALTCARLLPSPSLWATVILVLFAARAAIGYAGSLTPVTLIVDGHVREVRTHCTTVGEVLNDVGVEVSEWDAISPDLHVVVRPGIEVSIHHARPVSLVADGATRTLYTHQLQVDAILREAGLVLKAGDRLWVNGQYLSEDRDLQVTTPHSVSSRGDLVRPAVAARARSSQTRHALMPVSHLEVQRSALIHVYDGGIEQPLRTTMRTVGQALREAGVLLYLGDRVSLDVNAPVQTGMRVHIERGVPVSVLVDGRAIRTRTRHGTVGEVLAELGVSLIGRDFCSPGPDQAIRAGLEISVSRMVEKLVIEENEIPFETQWIPDSSLELDHRRVDVVGASGVRRRRYRAVFQDGIEIERRLEEEWIAREPQARKIAYGTKIVVRTLETPDGPIEYWRRINVFLTSYTEATCGKTPDHPWYGLTRLGWRMRKGIIAVDPTVINMLTEMYVPGYGRGIAADTGGLIIGRHIDLGHEVGDFTMYFEWGYVYLLTPQPPPDRIRYIVPDFPRGRYR